VKFDTEEFYENLPRYPEVVTIGKNVGRFTCRLQRGADKSLARPGRNKATETKLGIYSTYSP